LGQSRTVQELVRLVRSRNPKIVFLWETRQTEERVKNLRFSLGLKNWLAWKKEGFGGGLGLFWDQSMVVDL